MPSWVNTLWLLFKNLYHRKYTLWKNHLKYVHPITWEITQYVLFCVLEFQDVADHYIYLLNVGVSVFPSDKLGLEFFCNN